MTDYLFEDIGVHLIDMDTMIREQVILNEDGSFSIFINARLNHEAQLLAYQHALLHILNDDFHKEDVDEIESVAHKVV